ncbi:hypothetical protein [Stutzerimonas stutzeri]|uniref:hypothetical protein n=1 Tax=Stutzerimonas stutzeri TaxID=316 RepID=UPI001C491D8E|nr:hypothetical protein [Stutzerimonas stutzeri]
MSAAAKKPIAHSPADLLRARKRDLKEVRQLIGQAQLSGKPEEVLLALEDEALQHQRQIERLTLAIAAGEQQQTEATLAARTAKVRQAQAEVERLDAGIERQLAELQAALVAVAPLAAQLQADLRTRQQIFRDGLRTAFKAEQADRLDLSDRTGQACKFALRSSLKLSGLLALAAPDELGRIDEVSPEQVRLGLVKAHAVAATALAKAQAAIELEADPQADDDLDEEL